jgi:YfiH family protein
MPLTTIHPDWPAAPCDISSLATERAGGMSRTPYDDGQGGGGLNLGMHVGDDPARVLKNRELLRSMLPGEPIWLAQIHGNTVIDADELSDAEIKKIPAGDAIVASLPRRVCAIQTADCLPVLFSSLDGRVVGAAHAGWRGLAAGILENTVRQMHGKGAQEITAWLGPAIGPEKFEVGREVVDAFTNIDSHSTDAFRKSDSGDQKYLADIYLLARMALQREGISRISGGGFCTVTEKSRFYSYRRDGVTGRMVSLIWIG